MRRLPRIAAAAVALGCLALGGAALAASKVVGTIAATKVVGITHTSATLSYRSGPVGLTAQRLMITADGRKLYSQLVKSRYCDPCAPNPFIKRKRVLKVLDLAGDGQLEVLLSLFTGGAHCCVVDQVYTADSVKASYVRHEHEFDAGATVTDIGKNGRFEFVSADGRFAYEFSDYAHSGQPIQIWTFSRNRFHTVTGHYPGLIRADAAKWMRAFSHSLSNGVGLIAAWAADEDRLGNSSLVNSTLSSLIRKGKLRSGDRSYASGKKFIAQLQRFLRQTHYTR